MINNHYHYSLFMKTAVFFLTLFVFTTVVTAQQTVTHTSTAQTVSRNSSFLDIPGLANNPLAIITVEPNEATRIANPHPLGVWYDGSRWAIFNQDLTAMQAGLVFRVHWSNPDAQHFYRKVTPSLLDNGKLVLDHAYLNGNPQAKFSITQLWNPEGTGGLYNKSTVVPAYDSKTQRWSLRNEDGSSLVSGLAFNFFLQSNSVTTVNKNTISSGTFKSGNPANVHPLNNRQFRLICTGFSVVTATDDDLLESDGAGDEVFFTYDILETTGIRRLKHTESVLPSITEQYQLKSKVHGAAQKTLLGTPTGYIRAGSKSPSGGLQQGDIFPENGQLPSNAVIPYNRTNPASFPLLVWEGTLNMDKRVFINICPWEFDDDNTRLNVAWPDFAKAQLQAYYFQDSMNLPAINCKTDFLSRSDLTPQSADMLGTQPFWSWYNLTLRSRRIGVRRPQTIRVKTPAAQMLCLKLEGIDDKGYVLLAPGNYYIGMVSRNRFDISFQNSFSNKGNYRMHFRLELVE